MWSCSYDDLIVRNQQLHAALEEAQVREGKLARKVRRQHELILSLVAAIGEQENGRDSNEE